MPCIRLSLFVICFTTISLPFSKNTREEKHFVVIICTYNNGEWAEKNIKSVVEQKYNNFDVIIIDDNSTDGTDTIIQDYIDTHHLASRVTFIRNPIRKRKLANLYRAIHSCNDNDIVVLVDGDDWLVDPSVLAYINEIYQNPHIWFTYGQYHNVPASEALRWGFRPQGYCRAVPEKIKEEHAYRSYTFVYMHLRTFYAWLFKNIKLEDLLCNKVQGFEGNFYPASNDNAIFFPIIEMAANHVKFVSKVLYTRNLYSDIVGFKVDRKLQCAASREIRRKRTYPVLENPIKPTEKIYNMTTECLLFVPEYGTISSLHGCIKALEKHVSPLSSVTIFCEQSKKLVLPQNSSLSLHVVTYDQTKLHAFSAALQEYLQNSKASYIICLQPYIIIEENIDLKNAILWLEQTKAYAFYFTYDARIQKNNVSWLVSLYDGVGAWKFRYGYGIWRDIHTADFALYRTRDVRSIITTTKSKTYSDFRKQLRTITYPEHKIGLFFEKAKAKVKIPQ
jgi:hypothetical protein